MNGDMIIGYTYRYKKRTPNKFPQKSGYFITIDDNLYGDFKTSYSLKIDFDIYKKILISCNALFYHENGYYFDKKENVEAAVVALTLFYKSN